MKIIIPRNWGAFATLAIIGLVLLFVGLAFCYMFGWVILYERAITLEKQRLVTRFDHSVLAAAYDQLIADGKIDFETSGMGWISDKDLPPEIRVVRPNAVYCDANAMYLEYGGGFHHFGLKVLKSPINDKRPKEDEERMIDDRTFIYDHGG